MHRILTIDPSRGGTGTGAGQGSANGVTTQTRPRPARSVIARPRVSSPRYGIGTSSPPESRWRVTVRRRPQKQLRPITGWEAWVSTPGYVPRAGHQAVLKSTVTSATPLRQAHPNRGTPPPPPPPPPPNRTPPTSTQPLHVYRNAITFNNYRARRTGTGLHRRPSHPFSFFSR